MSSRGWRTTKILTLEDFGVVQKLNNYKSSAFEALEVPRCPPEAGEAEKY
jgi:hypothetical protein